MRIDYDCYAGTEVLEVRNDQKLTVLYRPVEHQDEWVPPKIKGGWSSVEVAYIAMRGISVIGSSCHPGYLILQGHYSRTDLPPVLSHTPYLIWTVSSLDDKKLPFIPNFV